MWRTVAPESLARVIRVPLRLHHRISQTDISSRRRPRSSSPLLPSLICTPPSPSPFFLGLLHLLPPASGSTLAPTLTLMTGTDSIRILEFLVHPRSSVPTERERREMMWSRSQCAFYGRRQRSALSFRPAPIPSCLSFSSTSPHVVHRGSGSTRTIAFTVIIRYRPADILEPLPPWAHQLSCALFLFTRAHNAPPMPDLITSEPTPAFFSQQSPSSSSGSLHLSPNTPRPTFSVLDRARSRSS